MPTIDQWLKDNKLTAYADKFKDAIDELEDLSSETLGTDEEIKQFVKDDIGETKTVKSKKIFNAIKKLQQSNDAKLDVQTYGFNFNDIMDVTEERQITIVSAKYSKRIATTEKQYYELNVTDAMQKLATCGSLIQLAYASSHGFKCQAQVAKLLSKYHTLVKDSFIASASFVTASMTALEFHKISYEILKKNPDKSILFISKCSSLAGKMAQVAGNLRDKAQQLANIAEIALEQAVTDRSITTEERKKVKGQIAKAKAEADKLEKLTKQLAQQHQQIKAEEAQAIKEAKKERDRAFVKAMVDSTIGAVAGVFNGGRNNNNNNDNNNNGGDEKQQDVVQGKTIEDRAWLLTQKKYEIQDKLIDQNAELGKTLTELTGYGAKKDDLQRALKSIELTIKTLGRIKVIFANTKVFWEGVQKNCDRLKQIGGNVRDFVDDPKLFENQLKKCIVDSALNWFVLCKVNYTAKKAICQVDKGMDAILNNLPDESEVPQLVQVLSGDLKQQLQEETAKIKEQRAIEASK